VRKQKGFTLIELLVVIAVIAVLMGVLVPALRAAREQGRMIRCGANVRNLTLAWLMYKDDNDGQLVPAAVYSDHHYSPEESNWWVGESVDNEGPGDSEEDETEGIRRGLLYPYVKDVSAYHCPSDIRTGLRIDYLERMGGYRSYAIPFAAYGTSDISLDGMMILSKKYMDIKSPASKYVFVPELDAHLFGGWIFDAYNEHWMELMAIWHSRNRSTLGWADGHVDSHRWQDKATIELASLGIEWIQGHNSPSPWLVYPDGVHTGEDVRFMSRGFPVKKLLSKPRP